MPFIAIDSTEVDSGKPVATTTLGKVKDNFDDHEERIQILESGVGTTYPPLIFRVGGPYSQSGALTGIIKTTTNFNILITGARLLIDKAGSSGTTEIDVQFKRGAGAWTSIFSTRPSVSYTAGDDSISSNAVLNPSYTTLQAGDLIRLDITSVQAYGRGFTVRLDYSGA